MRTLAALTLSLALAQAMGAGPAPSPERQGQLRYLLEQDCGSCHGLTLHGGLGPPLLPRALAGKPPSLLTATLLYGRPGTAMPPWAPFMTEREAAWLVERLLAGDAP
jgi:cytochrome c55X